MVKSAVSRTLQQQRGSSTVEILEGWERPLHLACPMYVLNACKEGVAQQVTFLTMLKNDAEVSERVRERERDQRLNEWWIEETGSKSNTHSNLIVRLCTEASV